MEEKVKQYIADHELISGNAPVLVALSGGRDSVALLSVFRQIKCEVIALHCNFHLRGDESIRDEKFVRSLCEQWNINLVVRHFDTLKYCEEKKVSIEMAARELRYAWFNQMLKSLRAQAIAVAHHQNDQAETLLQNIIRGTGLRGLCAMRPKNQNVIRPLLCVTRQEIDDYLTEQEIPYVDDSTNSDVAFKRNKIRHCLIPQMQEMNPSIVETLNKETETFQRISNLYDYCVKAQLSDIIHHEGTTAEIDIQKLTNHPYGRELLYEALRDNGFNSEQCDLIFDNLQSQSGKRFYSPNFELIKDRNSLIMFSRSEDSPKPQITIKRRSKNDKEHFPSAKAKKAFFNTTILDQPLSLRHWQEGDSFYPIGMNGKKKLSDFFTDQKLSIKQKRNIWILLSGDEIAWIIGQRIDNRFKVHHSSTQIVEIEVV